MEPNLDVLATLAQKSTETSIEALAKRGKRNVRVIRAKDIAWMIQEALERALASSEWVEAHQLEELRARTTAEFSALKSEREGEQQRQAELEELAARLASEKNELEELAARLASEKNELETRLLEADASNSQLSGEIAALRARGATLDDTQQQNSAALEEANARERAAAEEAEELRHRLDEMSAEVAQLKEAKSAINVHQAAPVANGDTASALLMMRMMDEIQSLKSQQAAPLAAPAAPTTASASAASAAAAPASAAGGVDDKLQAIVGALNDKLEQLGKKMGVSAAVDTSELDFDGLVSHAVDGVDLESNMGSVEVEQRASSGIAANLARIKKLKGGGA